MLPREVPFGVYVPGRTPVHAMNPALKLVAVFAAITVAVFLLHGAIAIAAFAVVIGCAYLVARIPIRVAWTQIAAPLPLLVALAAFQWWQHDLAEAASTLAVLSLCILAASLVPLTTTIEELMDAVEKALQPLSRFGVPAERIGLAIALTIRLIPVQFAQVRQVLEARRARGTGFSLFAFATPVIIRSIRRARALAEALAARGAADD
ncbi:cobalt ABC transporter permease [Corynebacterium atypicum]|uniref:Cobalt ABC transporter permease n=2 Tax=Corynebacterium atypicum TaxID=191610 RepID=A0ABM5QMH4_9CORY|nr:cobalt ABC transporter permease [Corynebacterium atypicum]